MTTRHEAIEKAKDKARRFLSGANDTPLRELTMEIIDALNLPPDEPDAFAEMKRKCAEALGSNLPAADDGMEARAKAHYFAWAEDDSHCRIFKMIADFARSEIARLKGTPCSPASSPSTPSPAGSPAAPCAASSGTPSASATNPATATTSCTTPAAAAGRPSETPTSKTTSTTSTTDRSTSTQTTQQTKTIQTDSTRAVTGDAAGIATVDLSDEAIDAKYGHYGSPWKPRWSGIIKDVRDAALARGRAEGAETIREAVRIMRDLYCAPTQEAYTKAHADRTTFLARHGAALAVQAAIGGAS